MGKKRKLFILFLQTHAFLPFHNFRADLVPMYHFGGELES